MSDSRVPMNPGRVIVGPLARHEERIIVQPLTVVSTEGVECETISAVPLPKKSMSSFANQSALEVDDAVVLDVLLREARCIS